MKRKFVLVGNGNVGRALDDKVLRREDEIVLFDGRREDWKKVEGADLAFLAIPTLDDGRIAFDYIKGFLDRGVPVVTCEKGALSNYFGDLRDNLDRIGFSATVGGGTRMLKYMTDCIGAGFEGIHSVLNGSINYFLSGVSMGRDRNEVFATARRLGFLEPNSDGLLSSINTESCRDVPMKTAILANLSGQFNRIISAREIRPEPINESELDFLVDNADNIRHIVSITSDIVQGDVVGGFKYFVDGRYLSGGFRRLDEYPIFSELRAMGPSNVLVVFRGEAGTEGSYTIRGNGAGAFATASAMLLDADELLR